MSDPIGWVEPTTMQMPEVPCVVLWDGHSALMITDQFDGANTIWPPIAKRTTIARLRAIADVLEGTP